MLSSITGELSEIDNRIISLNSIRDDRNSSNKEPRGRRRTPLLKKLPSINIDQHREFSSLRNHRLLKSLDPSSYKEKEFIQKYFDLKLNNKPKVLRESKLTLSKPKFKKINAKILPRATRLDPISYPIEITEDDMNRGLYSLVNLGMVPKNSDLSLTLNGQNPPLNHHRALLHDWSIQFETSPSSTSIISKKIISHAAPKMDTAVDIASISSPSELNPINEFLYINSGSVVKDEVYYKLMEMNNNSESVRNLKKLEALGKEYFIKKIKLNLNYLISASRAKFTVEQLLTCTENASDIKLTIEKIEREKNEKLRRANAALHIQCCWRRYKGAAKMREHKLKKQKVNFIQTYYIKYQKKVSTKNYASSLRENRIKLFEKRQNDLVKNWNTLLSKKFIEIHIGSNLAHYPEPNDSQLTRVIFAENLNRTIVYISSPGIEIEIQNYYEALMNLSDINIENRIIYVNTDTLCSSVMTNTAKSLYLSSRALVQLKKQISGEDIVLIPFQTSEYDEYLSDFLKIPILGCIAPTVIELDRYSRRKLLENSGLSIMPGVSGEYTYPEFLHVYSKIQQDFKDRTVEVIISDKKVTNFSEWIGKAKILMQIIQQEEDVHISYFIDPHGNFTYNSCVKLLGSPAFAAVYPQDLFTQEAIELVCKSTSHVLFSRGIIGHVGIKLTHEGIVDFEIGINSFSNIHSFFTNILKGVAQNNKYYVPSQEINDLEQEVYCDDSTNFITYENFTRKIIENDKGFEGDIEERQYMWIWDVHSRELCDLSMSAILHMCRLQSVMFSLAKNEGTIYFPYGSLKNGCIGIMAVGDCYKNMLYYMAEGISIIDQIIFNKSEGNIQSIIEVLGIKKELEQIKAISKSKGYLVELV